MKQIKRTKRQPRRTTAHNDALKKLAALYIRAWGKWLDNIPPDDSPWDEDEFVEELVDVWGMAKELSVVPRACWLHNVLEEMVDDGTIDEDYLDKCPTFPAELEPIAKRQRQTDKVI
jgi:hypothetical protein